MNIREKLMGSVCLVWIAAFAVTVTYVAVELGTAAPFTVDVVLVNSDIFATTFTIQLTFQEQNDSVWVTGIRVNDWIIDRSTTPVLMAEGDTLHTTVPGNHQILHCYLLAQSFNKRHSYSVPFNVTAEVVFR
jgi:hypothetical protein